MGVDPHQLSWRRLTGWIAIYALVLPGILVGLAGPHLTPAAAPSYEICLHDVDGAAEAPGTLPGKHDGKLHCPLCVAGGQQVVAPTRVSVPGFVIADASNALWPASDQPAASSFRYSAHRSRAPPVVA